MSSAGSASNATQPVVASVAPLLPAWRLDRVFDYLVPEENGELEIGALVRVPFGGRNVRAVVLDVAERDPERELQPIDKVLLDEPVVRPPLDRLARWIADRYAVSLGKALDRFAPPRVRIVRLEVKPLTRALEPSLVPTYTNGPDLLSAIAGGASGTWCLNTLPSHDRGRVVAELVAVAGGTGGSALVAVPEVRFGSEVLEDLAALWPELARVDSTRSGKEQSESWSLLARGHGLGGGGRSTVFAPAPNLRVIVLNEEHHRTFKEDRSPRYDARRVAIERAKLQGAICVLVSDAPSVETAGAAARGEFGWVEAPRAARKEARPVVETVEAPGDGRLSQTLFLRVREALREERDVALLAPRPGYARVVWCAKCRSSLYCPRCESALAFRGVDPPAVTCPRCGFGSPPPDACPSCGARDFRFLGTGSRRLSEEMAKSFPRARVRRMDPETLESAGPATGAGDIYVTTWIGTKPEIRPEARLVAILDCDALLRSPEFRAAERGFQALADLARWAGPARTGGRLVIQTSEPSHPAIQAIARGDPRFFLERELDARKDPAYPPWTELLRAVGPPAAVTAAAAVATETGAEVLGPVEAPGPPRGRGPEHEFLAKTTDASKLAVALRPLLASSEGAGLRIDTDPRR